MLDLVNGDDGFRASDVSRVLNEALTNLRKSESELAQLQAIRNGAEELTRLGDDGSDPIGELRTVAIRDYELSPSLVQNIIFGGIELGMAPKAPANNSNLSGKERTDFYKRNPGAADVALEPNASQAVLRLDEWLKCDLGLQKLVIDSSNPTAAAKTLARFIAERDNFLFNGYAPVYVTAEAENMPKATVVKTETVRILAHGICAPVKAGKNGEFIPIAISEDIAGLYLRGLEGFWGLKPFNGITTAPILSDDGSIRAAEGYDPISGMWCHNIPAVQVPEHPTMEEAKAALGYIRHKFRTFPFADGERARDLELDLDVIDVTTPAGLDESSFLTMLLTGVCRQSLGTAPGLLCDGPSFSGAGTGKGLLVKAICVIASGARPAAFTSGHDEAELDKRLTSALVEARPAVFLDNFNAKELTSDILASVLTENPAMVRVMGQTKKCSAQRANFYRHNRQWRRDCRGHGAAHYQGLP